MTKLQQLYDRALQLNDGVVDVATRPHLIFMKKDGSIRQYDSLHGNISAIFQKRAFRHLSSFLTGTKKNPLATSIRRAVDYLYEDCPPDLRASNINYWLDQLPKNKELIFRNYDYDVDGLNGMDGGGMQVRAVTSNRYGIVDAHHVLKGVMIATENFSDDQLHIDHTYLDENTLHLRLRLPRVAEIIQTGNYRQPYSAGIYFSNGSVKNRRLVVAPYIQGGSCQNSVIVYEDYGFARNHNGLSVGIAHTFIYDLFSQVIKATPAILDRLAEAAREEMPDPAEVLRRLTESRGISIEVEHRMAQGLWEQGGATTLGLVNGITYGAHTAEAAGEIDHELRTELEILAGNILIAGPDNVFSVAVKTSALAESDDE